MQRNVVAKIPHVDNVGSLVLGLASSAMIVMCCYLMHALQINEYLAEYTIYILVVTSCAVCRLDNDSSHKTIYKSIKNNKDI